MTDHYYSANPQSPHKPGQVETEYRGQRLTFGTDSGVFSRTELDRGTEILLDALPEAMTGSLLDLGCGWGVIGVTLGKVHPGLEITMADINQRACDLSVENAEKNGVAARVIVSDGYEQLEGLSFDYIVQNPPIRAGKSVIYGMFARGAEALREGGSLWLVIRKQQGAPSAQNYLLTLFGSVEIVNKEAGYWIFCCRNPLNQKPLKEENRNEV